MQDLDTGGHDAHAQVAKAPVLPSPSTLVALLISIDQGRTWQVSGTFSLPTARYDAAARLFLMTAMSVTAEEDVTDVLWQAQAWAVGEGEAASLDTPPLVSLRSDGQLSNEDALHPLPTPMTPPEAS
jgi:hypothetical protein